MGLVTRQASDFSLAERSVRSGYRVSFHRMIGCERFIQIQELPALHLREGQSDTPRCPHSRLHSGGDSQSRGEVSVDGWTGEVSPPRNGASVFWIFYSFAAVVEPKDGSFPRGAAGPVTL